ncbi:MAG: acyl-CoA dehydrogenase family protein [Gammaproteobacteria bacterium]|nr:acyl-CoA dehydrogenase family protein [Gammaproteobacteria bacterium]MBI5616215.1 acyl-CoA dehydrogenase family protein [Gammaproteobacteria bacterium]
MSTTTTPAFWLSQDAQAMLDEADKFAKKELHPLFPRMDDEEWWPEDVFRKIGDAGFFGLTVPEEYGGQGLDFFTSGLVGQAMARWNYPLSLSWVAHENLCLNNIYRNSNEQLRRKYLPDLCSGRAIGALGLTEPGAGSDALGSMRTTAKRDGDYYYLNGRKIFITNGPVADVLLVYAKTTPEKGAHGISAFIVEKGFPGFSVAQKLVKMGFRGSQTGELVFDNCKVPAANLVGEEDNGVSVVMSGLDLERAVISPICVGIAERALELAIEYAQMREQFGKPIAKFQMIQSKIADMYVWVETMKTFCYRVLAECNDLEIGGGGRGMIHALSAGSIMYTADTLNKVLNEALQIFGGYGYMWDAEINRLYRANKLLEIGAGTTEVRKMIISGEVLGR